MKKRKGKAEVKVQPDEVFKKNAKERADFEKEFMPDEYKAEKKKKRKKRLIGFLAILLLLALAAFAVVKFVLPLFGGKEKESAGDYSSFVTAEEMKVEQTADSYTVTAKVTVPDMGKYIAEFGASGAVKEQKWDKAEKKLEEAFYKYLKKQKDLSTVTYDLEVDLQSYAEDYMLTMEYWDSHDESEPFAFTEAQIRDILTKEAFLRSMETLIYE